MISRLRKVFVLLFTLLMMFAGAFGWSGSMSSVSAAYQGSHTSSYHLLAHSSPRVNCPPPPYECD